MWASLRKGEGRFQILSFEEAYYIFEKERRGGRRKGRGRGYLSCSKGYHIFNNQMWESFLELRTAPQRTCSNNTEKRTIKSTSTTKCLGILISRLTQREFTAKIKEGSRIKKKTKLIIDLTSFGQNQTDLLLKNLY